MATPSRPRLQRGTHCVYDMHYHLIFTVKYRRALLTPEVVAELTRISLEIQERHEFQIETLGADRNPVHLLCAAHPVHLLCAAHPVHLLCAAHPVHLLCAAHPVHLLCAAHPKIAAGDIVRIYKVRIYKVRIYKGITARELFKALPSLRKELWGGAFWTSSYFAATVGQFGGYESVKRYVSVMLRSRGRRRRT